jgi:hypothetical protein
VTAFLSSFNNANPNGEWTLLLTDMQIGGTARLDRWSLQVTAVPESEGFGPAMGLGLLSYLLWRHESDDVRHRRTGGRIREMSVIPGVILGESAMKWRRSSGVWIKA